MTLSWTYINNGVETHLVPDPFEVVDTTSSLTDTPNGGGTTYLVTEPDITITLPPSSQVGAGSVQLVNGIEEGGTFTVVTPDSAQFNSTFDTLENTNGSKGDHVVLYNPVDGTGNWNVTHAIGSWTTS